jgi:hypothetical protein
VLIQFNVVHPNVIKIADDIKIIGLISPNPWTTDFVGKRCARPQKNGNAAPKYINILSVII